MKHIDLREFISGAVLIGVGLFVAIYAGSHYMIGEPARMGPGFFPVMLGWILAGLGSLVLVLSFRTMVHVLHPPPFRPRVLVAVLASVIVFSLSVQRLGLMPATFALVFVAAMAERKFQWLRTVLLGVSLAIIAWLIFVIGLQMPLQAFAFLE